jgi:hypothetical protein
MGKFEKICRLAQEKNISVREIFVKHLLTYDVRVTICEKMNKEDDEEYEPDDVYQMCDTPRSQQRLLKFF